MNTNRDTKMLRQVVRLKARHCNGSLYAYAVGMRVGITVYTAAPEGGMLQGYRYGVAKAVGYGQEANMLGDGTPLVLVVLSDGTERLVAARLVDPYELAPRAAEARS